MGLREEVVDVLKSVVTTVIINGEEDYERRLNELGVDSLDNMSFLLEIQEKFDIDDIPDEQAKELSTINIVVDYVRNLLEKRGG